MVILGDSILNGIQERGLRKNHHVKVYAHPGATTEDMIDYLKPVIRKNPDLLIVHGGTNDTTNDVDTTVNIERIVKLVKKASPETKLVLSSITVRKDRKDIGRKVDDLNTRLKNITKIHGIDMIENDNINEGHLSPKKLHLNHTGNSILANNFINYIKTF